MGTHPHLRSADGAICQLIQVLEHDKALPEAAAIATAIEAQAHAANNEANNAPQQGQDEGQGGWDEWEDTELEPEVAGGMNPSVAAAVEDFGWTRADQWPALRAAALKVAKAADEGAAF